MPKEGNAMKDEPRKNETDRQRLERKAARLQKFLAGARETAFDIEKTLCGLVAETDDAGGDTRELRQTHAYTQDAICGILTAQAAGNRANASSGLPSSRFGGT